MYEELDAIKNKCLSCHKCALGETRSNIVFSDGVPNPKLMLIGEAPGFYEDKEAVINAFETMKSCIIVLKKSLE